MASSPEPEREALIRAQAAFEAGRYRLAAGLWRALQVTGSQGVDETLLQRAEILHAAQIKLRRRDYQGAGRLLDEGMGWADEYRAALAALMRVGQSVEGGQPDEVALQAAASHAFTGAEALALKGLMYIRAGEKDRARVELVRALELDPEHTRALTNLGNLDLENGDYDSAAEKLRAAIKLDPEFALPHHNLAVVLRRQRKFGESVRHLKRAQQLDWRRHNLPPARAGGGPGSSRPAPVWRTWLWIGVGLVVVYLIFVR